MSSKHGKSGKKGTSSDDTLFGTNKADTLSGRGGNDTIVGGKGNDKIDGGSGNDKIFGGAGNDKINGGSGNDKVFGGAGNDKIDGGKGNDTIYGGSGNDKINGGSGDDLITGGVGADKLTGNSGNDHFIYLASSDSPAASGWDRITDFTQGHDKIDLAALLGTTDLAWGNTTATANGVWYESSKSSTFVYADTNNDGKADLKIELQDTKGLKLTVDDFIGVGGSNAAPVITSGAQAASITEVADNAPGENATTQLGGGTITFTDANALDTHTAASAPQGGGVGYLGTLTLDPVVGNSVAWKFSVEDSALDFLASGEVRTQNYDVTVNDGNGGTAVQTVTVTLTGTNDAPVATDNTGAATEAGVAAGSNADGNVLTDGVHDSDVDNDAVLTVSAIRTGTEAGSGTPGVVGSALAGAYGTLTLNSDGSYSYVVDNSNATVNALNGLQSLTDTFTYTVSDGLGGTDMAALTLTINGANDAPVAVADNVITDLALDGMFSIPEWALLANDNDPDGDPIDVQSVFDAVDATVTHTAGTTNSNGYVVFEDDGNNDGGSFSYRAMDGFFAQSAPATVTVTTDADGDDDLNGTPDHDILVAGPDSGPMTLIGIEGDDILVGNGDNNTLNGGSGNDILFGGNASDVFKYSFNSSPTVTSGDGFDTIVDFTWGEDQLEFNGLAGLTVDQFTSMFAATEADVNGDSVLDTTLALADNSWSVTLLDVSGHTEADFHATSVFS